jgi:hypothetical protein
MRRFKSKLTMPKFQSAAAKLRKILPTTKKGLFPALKKLPQKIVSTLRLKRKVSRNHQSSTTSVVNKLNTSQSIVTEDKESDLNLVLVEDSPGSDSPMSRIIQRETTDDMLRTSLQAIFHEELIYIQEISTVVPPDSKEDFDTMMDSYSKLFRFVLLTNAETANRNRIIRQEFDEFIVKNLVMTNCKDTSAMTPKQIAKVFSFVTYYRNLWREVTFTTDCKLQLEEMKSEYLRRGVHEQIKAMLENRLLLLTRENDDDVVEAEAGGLLCSHLCDDVAFFISCQLDVAKKSLPSFMIPAVMNACNEELHNLAGALMFYLEANWKRLSVERLCCCINDAQLMMDHFEVLNESILVDMEEDQEVNSEYNMTSESLLKEFSLVAIHATRFLCELLLSDVKQDYLLKIGTETWETNETIMETVIITLQDFFEDIINWIPSQYFFARILKTCVDLILTNYVDSFFVNTMSRGLKHPEKAIERILSDRLKLWHFFGIDHEDYLGQAGFYNKFALCERLHMLQIMSRILAIQSQSDLQPAEFEFIIRALGSEYGAAAIFHIFGLQQRAISKDEAQAWHETVAFALEHARMQGSDEISFYHTPDIRNSSYVKKMPKAERVKVGLDLSITNKLVANGKAVNMSKKLLASPQTIIRRKPMNTWRGIYKELSS